MILFYLQSPSIHLGSELDVGRDLMKGCSSIVHEAAALCNGRKPFTLYADPLSACSSYFWCAPARGACVLSCPQGVSWLGLLLWREAGVMLGFSLLEAAATCRYRLTFTYICLNQAV